MGNLGLYQILTALAKKVGGPAQLVGIIFGIGATAALGIEHGGKRLVSKSRELLAKGSSKKALDKTYKVSKAYEDDRGLSLEPEDLLRVLSIVDDVALIEVVGDLSNPYCISIADLKSISDFNGI